MQELILKFREKSREVFIAFMQERKALIDEKGVEVAEAELLEKYADMLLEPVQTPEEIQSEKQRLVETTVQQILDDEAKANGYDSIISACTYATSTGTFGAEGQSFVNWRDAVWTHLYALLASVQNGTITEPTLEEIIAGLPTRVLP